MMDGLMKLYAILAFIPVIPFAVVLIGYGTYIKDWKRAFRLAMDVSTVFFIGCVAGQFNLIFNSEFGIYGIMLVMILTGGLLGNAQFRKRGKVEVKRIFRAVWRLSFFAMSVLYVVFMAVLIGRLLFTMSA
ncbi:DUF3397 domain-containing protein [Paenibacillus sp. J5C_2022]|uniref:DUF3397 domain-containing protein n=1 Tax=Paenibacillus sp. J5C2022 TaxID=2977129 RepID=UPI0021D19E43|nr:DUF3397 domain-containing protein [Paenibacillus sp. J5C2022]MCU6709489.1 DUF3397 domain-containing protein [Paenibacillus sp. J5C2022]